MAETRSLALFLDTPALAPLAASLRGYDRRATLPLIAGLFTLPDLHRFTLRLELLAHLAARHCRGRKAPRLADLNRWLGDLLPHSGYTAYEDPPPDVFVGNVMGPFGNHRVLQGVWTGNDLWLQELIDALYSCGERCQEVVRPLFALLALSDSLCEAAGLVRWQVASERPSADCQLRGDHRVLERARHTLFTAKEFARLDIQPGDLEPFILPKIGDSTIASDALERSPLVRLGDDLVLALPTAVSVALRHYLLERLGRSGGLGTFETVLRRNQSHRVEFHLRFALRADLLPNDTVLPPLAGRLPPVDLHAARFDDDKYALVVVLHADLERLQRLGFDDLSEPDESLDALTCYLTEAVDRLQALPGTRGGLLLLVFGGLGGSLAYSLPCLPDGWESMALSLCDFLLLANDDNASLLRWWKLHREIRRAGEVGVLFGSFAGECDLHAYWAVQDYGLVPKVVPYPGRAMLHVGLDYIAPFKARLRRGIDEHCVELPEDGFLKVVRRNSSSYWKSMDSRPVYAAVYPLVEGRWFGVIETPAGATWVRHEDAYEAPYLTDLAFRIWDTLLFWLHPLLKALEKSLGILRHPPVQIRFSLHGPLSYDTAVEELRRNPSAVPELLVPKRSSVELRLGGAFLAQFMRPENIAERRLLEAVVHGLMALYSAPDRVDAVSLVADLLQGDEARNVHVVPLYQAHLFVGALDRRSHRFIQPEDSASAWLGLAAAVGHRYGESRFLDAESGKKLLHQAVDVIWTRIHGLLGELDRGSVIERAYSNVEGLAQEAAEWVTSSRALIAMHPEALEVANRKDGERTQAGIAARILVEMAICSAPLDGARPASIGDLDELAALVDTLLEIADMSEAVHDGLADPIVQVFPNGEFLLPRVFVNEVMEHYRASLFGESFEDAAQAYEEHYHPVEFDDNALVHRFQPEFVQAFRAEFGLVPDRAIFAVRGLMELAIENETAVVAIQIGELHKQLCEGAGLTAAEATAFMDRFTLWPRPRWDRAPKGYKNRDWEPWRTKRRLSLVYRPLVRLTNEDSSLIVYGTNLLIRSLSYLMERLQSAELPQEFFHTDGMRTYQATRTDALGHVFNERVAQTMRDHGWNCRVEVQMTTLGAEPTYGDMDVIAWRGDDNRLLLIESKRLHVVRNVNEVGNLYREFKGEGRDRLDKALQRWRWVEQNLPAVLQVLGLAGRELSPEELLVTSADVPLRYMPELPFPTERVVPLVHLPKWLAQFG